MTMHLVGPYMTTTNYRKQKSKKLTNNQLDRLRVEWRQYNKRMRKMHCHSAQFETFNDYLDYVQGKTRKATNTKRETYVPPKVHRRGDDTQKIPSHGDGVGNGFKKESSTYTGDLICGIATMHKSNAVPIMRGTDQAKDIAKMRR